MKRCSGHLSLFALTSFSPLGSDPDWMLMVRLCSVATCARYAKSDYLTNICHLCWASKADADPIMPTFHNWSAQCATTLRPKRRPISRCHGVSHVTFK